MTEGKSKTLQVETDVETLNLTVRSPLILCPRLETSGRAGIAVQESQGESLQSVLEARDPYFSAKIAGAWQK
jgi:hypothetical protein